MLRPVLLLALFVALLAGCSSGKSALRRGDFDLAVKRAAQRLSQRAGLSRRGHATAPTVLKQAFELAYQQHQSAIRRLSVPSADTPFRWERVYQEYVTLQTLTDEVRRGLAGRIHAGRIHAGRIHAGRIHAGRDTANCASCADWLATYPGTDRDRQLETRALAAADRYEAAEQAFTYRRENRLAARNAYEHYRKTLDWVPNYAQAAERAGEVLDFALLRVLIEPISPSPELSPDDNLHLQELIMRQIAPDEAPSTFVRLYPLYAPADDGPTLADGWPIHQSVQMVVTTYLPYHDYTSSSSTTVYSNQLYKVGEKKINDSTTVDVLEKVKGTLTTYRREINARLDLSMRALDAQTGAVLWEEPIGESRDWFTEWQTFQGDDRALNGHTLLSASLLVPSRWSLFNNMRDELATDVVHRLRRKYAHD